MFLIAVGLSLGALLLEAMVDRLRKLNIRTEVLLAGVGALFIVAELALVLPMRRFLVRFSESEASNHTPPLADFTTTAPELKFSVETGGPLRAANACFCCRPHTSAASK
jgi:hypothetical protein